MNDARNSMQPISSERIDLGAASSIDSWTVHLAVGEQELREAVDAVGNCPAHVGDYLGIRA